jgi:hypothetical protein
MLFFSSPGRLEDPRLEEWPTSGAQHGRIGRVAEIGALLILEDERTPGDVRLWGDAWCSGVHPVVQVTGGTHVPVLGPISEQSG